MDHLFVKLGDEHGVSKGQIEKCLDKIPFSDHTIAAVRTLGALGCEQRILSDANSVFIDRILASRDLARFFSTVATNPARWEPLAGVCSPRGYLPLM